MLVLHSKTRKKTIEWCKPLPPEDILLRPGTDCGCRDEAKRRQVVQERIRVLEEALVDSKFEPERENIRGAIEEYRSGRLGYVRHYTLFWAGKPVDTAETYADFAKDRRERLDRYAQ